MVTFSPVSSTPLSRLASFCLNGKKILIIYNIVPIFKTPSSSSGPHDYHPISLLSLTSKVLERHIHNFLHNFCTTHDILSPSQYGFCSDFSTEIALLSVTQLHGFLPSILTSQSVLSFLIYTQGLRYTVPHKPLLSILFPPLAFLPIFPAGSQTTYAIEHNKLF